MSDLQNIKEIISTMSPEDAIAHLTEMLSTDPQNDAALYHRGRLYWKRGDTRLALNDYNASVAINADSPARLALESANNILDFYNKDLYNP